MRLSHIKYLLLTLRPRQWVKNGVLFAALVFDRQLNPAHLPEIIRTTVGFLIFCLISGLVYLINDLVDVEADRKHPQKRQRPIAAGKLPPSVALGAAIILPLFIFPFSYWLSAPFAWVGLGYFGLNLAYSKWLKHIPLIDVFAIAAGFVLRVAAGVVLIQVARFSPWLYVVTTLGSLYIGFGKRRAELALLAEDAITTGAFWMATPSHCWIS